jgi:hypothetical protein
MGKINEASIIAGTATKFHDKECGYKEEHKVGVLKAIETPRVQTQVSSDPT